MSRSGEFTTEQIQTALDPLHSSLESMASRPDLGRDMLLPRFSGGSVEEFDKAIREHKGAPIRDDNLWRNSWKKQGNDVAQHKFAELTESIRAGREVKLSAGKPPWPAGPLRTSLVESWYRSFGQTNTTENAYAILEQAANRLEELGNNNPNVKYLQANMLLDAVESNRLLDEKIQAKEWQAETTGRAKELLLQARTEFFRDFSSNRDGKTLKKFIDAEAKLFDIDFREDISRYQRLDATQKPAERERMENELVAYIKVQNDFYKSCKDNQHKATGAITEVATEALLWYALLQAKATAKVRVRQSFEREDRSNVSQQPNLNFDLLLETATETEQGFIFTPHYIQLKSGEQNMVRYDINTIAEYNLDIFGKNGQRGHYQLLETMAGGDRRSISEAAKILLQEIVLNFNADSKTAKGRLARDLRIAITGK